MGPTEIPADSSLVEPVDVLVATCLEKIETHFENAIDELIETHPALERAIGEEVEALRVGGLGLQEGDSWQRESRGGAAKPDADLEPIGPYQPLEEIGRGGQGFVYLAEDRRLGRVVALKILKGFGPLSEKLIQRFRREAEVASRLDHPGICPVYDAGTLEGIPYIAMRFVAGDTLARRIQDAKTTSADVDSAGSILVDLEDEAEVAETAETADRAPATTQGAEPRSTSCDDVMQVVEIIEKAARALHAAHEAGIIHRDVKPGNIMVQPSGDPVLLDFGLAGEEANELSLTQSGDFFGTPAYMSPEQLISSHIAIDRRSDVFSLGVTLFECVTLKRPFDAPTREAMYQTIQVKDPPHARKLNPHISSDLEVVIEKALEKDPDRRYQTALAFAEDLARIREMQPIAARPVGTVGRVARWARRRPARAALVAVLIVGIPAVTLLGGYAWAKQPQIEAAREQEVFAEVERHVQAGYHELAHGRGTFDVALASFDAALALHGGSAEALGGKAFALHRRGRHDACLAVLDQAHGLTPDVKAAFNYIRVDVLRALDRIGEADALEKNLPDRPRTAIGSFLNGVRLLKNCQENTDPKRFHAALDSLERAVLTAPHARPLYHFQLAHAAGHARREAPARKIARALCTLWPESYEANRWAGYALEHIDPGAALVSLRKSLELKPDHYPTLANLLDTLMGTGRSEECIAALRKAIALRPEDATLYNHLGAIYADDLRDYDEALEWLDRAIGIDPELANAHRSRGMVLVEKGRFDEAIASFDKALEIDPTYAHAHLSRGIALRRSGRVEKAIRAYEDAIRFDPNDAEAYNALGGLRCDVLRQYDQALKLFQTAITVDPKNATAHYNRGEALKRMGRLDEAVDAYETSNRLEPSARTYTALGSLHCDRLGQYATAQELFEKALKLRPTYAKAHGNLGVVLRHQGRHDEAIAAFKRSIELSDGDVMVYCNLGLALTWAGDYEAAIEWLKRAVVVNPSSGRARGLLGGALLYCGRLEQARVCLEKAVRMRGGSSAREDLRGVRRMLVARPKLAAVLAGRAEPASTWEAQRLAQLARHTQQYGTSVALWRDALGRDAFDDDQRVVALWQAAQVAPLAAAGLGDDAPNFTAADRLDFLRDATDWLEDAFAAWTKWIEADETNPHRVTMGLRSLAASVKLAPVRNLDTRAELPAAERRAWTAYWSLVDRFITELEKREKSK